MYFFAHLYYTDIISITAVLGLVLFNMRNEHNTAALFGTSIVNHMSAFYRLHCGSFIQHDRPFSFALFVFYRTSNVFNISVGFASVLMRQTNIVWVGMALGQICIDKFVSQTMPFVKDADKTGKVDLVYTFKV